MPIFASLILAALVPPQHVPAAPQLGLPARPLEFIVTLDSQASGPSLRLWDPATGHDESSRLGPILLGAVGIELLPLDATGRTELTEFLPGSGRSKGDAVFLPGNRGSIHRFRRPTPSGPRFGFIYAPFSGVPKVLFERSADPVGADPFVPFVALGPLGRGFAVATTLNAGGDLLELGVDSGAVILRTPGAVPHEFGRGGLMLGATWGFGVATDGIWRFQRGGSSAATVVPAPGGSNSWTGEAAVSPRRAFGVALGVTSGTQGIPFAFGPSGPAFPAASVPSNLAGAGYAQDSSFGPFLAISDDARTVAWRVEGVTSHSGSVSNEVMVGRLGNPSVAAAASGDAFLADTIAEVGRVIPSPDGGILFAAGEPNDPTEGGLEAADLFKATMSSAGSLILENVSGSSGDLTVPFTGTPTWTPARMVLVTPTVLLIQEDDAKQLLALDLSSGVVSLVLDSVREVEWIEVTSGGGWCAAVERDTPNRERQLVGGSSITATVLDAGGPATNFIAPALDPSHRFVAYVRTDFGSSSLNIVEPGPGTRISTAVPGATGIFGPLGFVGAAGLSFTALLPGGGRTVSQWDFAGTGAATPIVSSAGGIRVLR